MNHQQGNPKIRYLLMFWSADTHVANSNTKGKLPRAKEVSCWYIWRKRRKDEERREQIQWKRKMSKKRKETVYWGNLFQFWKINPLPRNKTWSYSELKAFTDDKCYIKQEIFHSKCRKYCVNKRKCWLPAFFVCFFHNVSMRPCFQERQKSSLCCKGLKCICAGVHSTLRSS